MGKVIAAAAYSAGRKVADIAIKESGQWAAKPDHFVWIGSTSQMNASCASSKRSFNCTISQSRTRSTHTSDRSWSSTAIPPFW